MNVYLSEGKLSYKGIMLLGEKISQTHKPTKMFLGKSALRPLSADTSFLLSTNSYR